MTIAMSATLKMGKSAMFVPPIKGTPSGTGPLQMSMWMKSTTRPLKNSL